MKNFLLAGVIVDDDSQKYAYEDVTPTQVSSFMKGLQKDEEVTIEITSPGGSCTAGLAIANLIKKASAEGHKTTAHVIGLAASMASVIACACDEVQIDSTAFMMVHNPWSCVQGNATELRKEADNLDKFKSALLAIYRTKFTIDDNAISRLMDEETWLMGSESSTYSLKCSVIPVAEGSKACASMTSLGRFGYRNIPTNLKTTIEGNSMESETKEVIKPNEPAPQAETITVEEAERRVSGMQSAMAKQVNDLKVQLQGREEELTKVKAEVISLKDSLEKVEGELHKTASALAAKEKALETLNANVNKQAEEMPTLQEGLANCKTPAEKVAFISSGRYRKQ